MRGYLSDVTLLNHSGQDGDVSPFILSGEGLWKNHLSSQWSAGGGRPGRVWPVLEQASGWGIKFDKSDEVVLDDLGLEYTIVFQNDMKSNDFIMNNE